MEKQKIKLHDFLAKPYMDVYYKGEKHTLLKNDVYGFKDCHGNTFRFFADMEYKLVEEGNIHLYVLDQMYESKKAVNVADMYYFSINPSSQIKALNLINLKNAFPENKKFHHALDENLNSVNIAQFDSIHKMYRVNYIYLESLKEK